MLHPTEELLDDILLSQVEGIGSRTYQRLTERFGSSTAILNAARSDLSVFEFRNKDTLTRLLSARQDFDARVIFDLCRQKEIDIVSLRDQRYPVPLRTIDDPPPILYVRGQILPQDAVSIAVIGTRRSSVYGRRQTERLTEALARSGFTIVSGLARGVDAVAHSVTVKAEGRTLAVLGSGHLKLYPPEHHDLAERIVESGGAVLSEYPPLHPSATWTFPQRNRIISGLSLGVLVIEAPLRSGAMISARLAGEQGRDIFAVPGSIESEFSRGCHQLIRDGAYLVDSIDDILNVLGPMSVPVRISDTEALHHPAEISLNDIERKVLQLIGTKPTSLESIVSETKLTPQQVQAVLSVLENKRMIRCVSSDRFIRL